MYTDPIADLLTRIRNAQLAVHRSVKVRASKMNRRVLEVLKKEGLIESFSAVKSTPNDGSGETAENTLEIVLRYYESGEPLMAGIKRMSTPGQRQYVGVKSLPKIFGGLGISILSTSEGVMSDREARKRGIGGELLAVIN